MSEQKQGCTERTHQVISADLPLCCPRHDERVWDAHPRVYLAIDEATGEAICPYCDTRYRPIA